MISALIRILLVVGVRHPQQIGQLGMSSFINSAGLEPVGQNLYRESAASGAPHMDLIITVCDSAAGEVCPIWPGHPASAHWGYADPSAGDAPDEVKREAFRQTLHAMGRRLALLLNLPPEKLQKNLLQDTARSLSSH